MADLLFRPATADDADMLARVINGVSGGVVSLLLDGLIPGMKADSLLAMALRDGKSHYSYTNCIMAECSGEIMGLLFAYGAEKQGIPPVMSCVLPETRIAPVRELLSAVVPDSLYVNTLWVAPEARGLGLADALMDVARARAADRGFSAISLFVWSDNLRALHFYEAQGFQPVRLLPSEGPLIALHPGGGWLYVLE